MAAHVLVLGDSGGVGEALIRRLEQLGAGASFASADNARTLAARLGERQWTAAVVLSHDDALALRLTLLAAHLRPDLALWVGLFDHTIAHQLRQIAPTVNVVAPAELVATTLADHLERLGARPHPPRSGVRLVDDALRLMARAGGVLLTGLVAQTVITMIALHDRLVNAIYFGARSILAAADVPRAAGAGTAFKLLSTVITLASMVAIAVFTAALVRRLSRPRHTALLGRRRVPARHHVLLIGFGQIGFRLAQELGRRGIPVVALERDPEAQCLRLARRARIPVVLGRGDDREMLEQVGVRSCSALAAVTSDDLANVSVGLAATDIRPGLPLVLRLGDGEVAAETESLLHLADNLDAHRLVASMLAERLLEAASTP
jgi:Trk K+ transport system NAD-binding subunit